MVTDDETVTIKISFEKISDVVAVNGISEEDISASLTNGEIVPGSLNNPGDGKSEFSATFTSYQKMIFDLPAGAGNFEGEDTLRVFYEVARVPEVPHKHKTLSIGGGLMNRWESLSPIAWNKSWIPHWRYNLDCRLHLRDSSKFSKHW